MSSYERSTSAGSREALRMAAEILPKRIPLEKVREDRHSVTLSGGDGTVTITAHRHGLDTVIHASTDQLRTSRIDLETQYYMNQLPYQPGDQPMPKRGG